ncbi:MAG TPA: ATP-binding protein [Chitinophagaceae bacterium]|nr:ATP-binding protein [Chitinophagaceae bacterium]
MRKIVFLLMVIMNCTNVSAQYKVTFSVKENTFKKHDSIYVVGSFNNWDSLNNNKYLLTKNKNGEHCITLSLKPGTYQYKYHRGNWFTVQKNFAGGEIDDKAFKLNRDTALADTIFAWRDEIISDKWNSLSKETDDSTRLFALYALANIYGYFPEWYQIDSSLHYVSKTLLLLQTMKAEPGYSNNTLRNATLFYTQVLSADLLHSLGNFSKELELRLDNLLLAKDLNDQYAIASSYFGVANTYASVQDYNNALIYGKKLNDYLLQNSGNSLDWPVFLRVQALRSVSFAYLNLNKFDSALYYANLIGDLPTTKYLSTAITWEDDFKQSSMHQLLGDIYLKAGKESQASENYRSVLSVGGVESEGKVRARYGLAMIYYKQGLIDSAFFYGKGLLKNINDSKINLQSLGTNANSMIAEIGPFVAELYRTMNMPDKAYDYLKLAVAMKDSLFNLDKTRQFQNLSFNESLRAQQQEQDVKIAKQQYQSKVRTYIFIGGLTLLALLAFILYKNNRQQQKAKAKIENAYGELKSTQQQLIQAEKMASLGELTAGIAHEIQNPLNFVNNFSEVNKELVDELKGELATGNVQSASEILNDIKDNSEKINHHGKRADAIVKGMLQHSRSSSGVKEPTDINALCDEYLRLSYHGLRAKDKSFNAIMKTDFDNSIGKINVVPQEIGRVVLNLINNAFYAVDEKKKQIGDGYEPTVSVSTKKMNEKIEIKVADSGNGIPQKVVDKIFQPFFTTKPTGQGTGLGLSLSYDIIKAHGGEIKMETTEGEGTVFSVILGI